MSPRETGESVTTNDRDGDHSRSVTRRRFLKRGAVVAAGVATLYVAPSFSSVTASPAYASITGTATPTPPTEINIFDNSVAIFEIITPDGSSEAVTLYGPSTIHSLTDGGDTELVDPTGHDMIETEIVALNLAGTSAVGPMSVGLQAAFPSTGHIVETVNNTPGRLDLNPFHAGAADSFFDVFFVIEFGGLTLTPQAPIQIEALVNVNPAADELFTSPSPIRPLLDETGSPTGYAIRLVQLQFIGPPPAG